MVAFNPAVPLILRVLIPVPVVARVVPFVAAPESKEAIVLFVPAVPFETNVSVLIGIDVDVASPTINELIDKFEVVEVPTVMVGAEEVAPVVPVKSTTAPEVVLPKKLTGVVDDTPERVTVGVVLA